MPLTRNAPYARNLRASYRQHLVKAANNPSVDHDYNPVLDDAGDPRNPRGWTHGTLEGYRVAGCKCPPCAQTGRETSKREADTRIANRIIDHRARLTVLLTHALRDTSAEQAAQGADAVVRTHRVTDRYRAVLAYDPVAVRKELRQWGAPALLALDDDALTDLVTTITAELQK